ncbi:YbaB/EbfC family nucleoid-associated protein [Pimelobacter simplex]|uniref:YbaB/EbfC family nucleoid-associated protein n=1 Tax=Nocardioides simplex TaxID=2045 RepID=UPI0019329D29|nr:YbaB/EbfC family nucleoid-associated protein [Pimelobacter simplex]
MVHLDPDGHRLLEALAADRPDAFAEVPPTSGTDRARALTLTVDAARRVIGVDVLDIAHLRHAEPFRTSLEEAFFAADGERLYAVLRANGQAEAWLARADLSLAGSSPLRVRSHGPDVSREASLERRAARGPELPRRRRPAPGTSDNGFLTVQRSPRGDIVDIEVDESWLSGARPEHLEAAIAQATRYSLGD